MMSRLMALKAVTTMGTERTIPALMTIEDENDSSVKDGKMGNGNRGDSRHVRTVV